MPKKVRKPNFYENRRKQFYGDKPVEKVSKTTDKPKKSLDEVLAEYRAKQ